ncbi:MAG: hypothetical protein J6333_04030 [Planctomycetes bacterium]|nr:hypothetical protein [Planctomycetota bacterium]
MKKTVAFVVAAFAWLVAFAARGGEEAPTFNFSFSPSRSQLGVCVETDGQAGAPVAAFKVTDVQDGRAVVAFTMPAKAGARKLVKLPALDGEYEIAMQLGGVKSAKRFERRRFPWEGNALGKSEKVYPPFIPIAVAGTGEGAKLKTVLREHVLGVGGLPAAVKAAGREILAGPARLVTDGGPVSGTLEIISKKPNRVVTRAQLRGPSGFTGTAEGVWEEDGCLDWRLTLKSGKIGSLTLEIPLAAETATMVHALGKMRETTSMTLPPEDGVVWAADRTPQLLANFCPYVYVGNAHRGLAWWAESPNGWGWSGRTPNCELVRAAGRVTLRVRLVDEATEIAAPRTLRLGLMAAPAKPRPADWLRRWNARNYHLIADDICWFSESGCGSVQPAGGFLSLWEWLGDCYLPGRQPDLARVEEILKPVDRYLAVYGPDEQRMLAREFRRLMRQHADWGRDKSRTPMLYFNRSVWNHCPEWKTYMGEWMLQTYNGTYGDRPSRREIYIEPCDSYLDYACWWWKKSFELTGNQGVYCDNYFNVLSANFWHPDGRDRNVIWALRAQAKRVRQMMCELGMEPFFWPHMSSQMVLPWMSFSDGQFDWEWNIGGGVLQRRFPREYLKIATWGELGGTVPKALMDRAGLADPRDRNAFVAGLNLCGMTAFFTGDGAPFDDKVRNVYQKSPRLRFWNSFMEGPLPVTCSDPTTEWCVWCVPGERALVEALSWNPEGGQAAVFKVDWKALGLPVPAADGAPGAETAALKDQSLALRDLLAERRLPVGRQGFTVKFGPYGVFVGEFAGTTPAPTEQ